MMNNISQQNKQQHRQPKLLDLEILPKTESPHISHIFLTSLGEREISLRLDTINILEQINEIFESYNEGKDYINPKHTIHQLIDNIENDLTNIDNCNTDKISILKIAMDLIEKIVRVFTSSKVDVVDSKDYEIVSEKILTLALMNYLNKEKLGTFEKTIQTELLIDIQNKYNKITPHKCNIIKLIVINYFADTYIETKNDELIDRFVKLNEQYNLYGIDEYYKFIKINDPNENNQNKKPKRKKIYDLSDKEKQIIENIKQDNNGIPEHKLNQHSYHFETIAKLKYLKEIISTRL